MFFTPVGVSFVTTSISISVAGTFGPSARESLEIEWYTKHRQVISQSMCTLSLPSENCQRFQWASHLPVPKSVTVHAVAWSFIFYSFKKTQKSQSNGFPYTSVIVLHLLRSEVFCAVWMWYNISNRLPAALSWLERARSGNIFSRSNTVGLQIV